MKKFTIFLFCLMFFAIKGNTQCINADFSSASFTNWWGSTGGNSAGSYSSEVVGFNIGTPNSLPSDPGQHTIINAPGTDPNTGGALSVLPPGGSSCCRLGNENTNYGAERLRYTLSPVTSSNCIFTYQYAVVLEDPSHPTSDQPKFTIYIKDAGGNVVGGNCGIYEVSAQGGISGFQDATHAADAETTRWKNWTTVGVDLSSYIGQTISIEFTTYDCAQGAHFGYAYISCSCGSLQLAQQCMGTSSIVTAPAGFSSYQWSSGQTTQSVTYNLPPYNNGDVVYVTCTSVQGCPVTLSTTLSVTPPVFTVNTPAPICAGQSATCSVTGPDTYAWSTGGTGTSVNVSPTTTTTYTVTATTAGGCSNTGEVIVTVNQIPVANAGPDVTTCPGQSVTLDASGSSGGSGTLSYNWSGGLGTTPQVTVTPASTTTYTVTVTSNGCTSTDDVIVTVANNLSVTATPATSNICVGGSATLTASGATTYTWSPATGLSSSTDATVTANPAATTTYTVTGISGGCSGTASVIVNVSGAAITVTPTNPQICNGGSVNITASGAGLTTYSWTPALGLSSTSAANVTANPTTTTTYTVTGSSAIGCSSSATVTVDVVTISTTATFTDENCGHANGQAGAQPAGNCSQNYTYTWSSGQNSQNINNLTQGTYTVTVNCGTCTATASVVIANLPGPSVQITGFNNTTCSLPNGSAVAAAVNGNGPYTYLWSNGQSGTNLSNVMAGTYLVTVTDANICTAVNTVTLTDTPPPTVQITNIVPENCGFANGSLTPTVNGGTPPYTYVWGTSPVQNSQVASSLTTGTYAVTVTDANGCTATVQGNVPLIPGPSVSALTDPEYCGQCNGSACANVTGGMGTNYTYLWSDGQTTNCASNLCNGSYTVTISDGGCSAATTANVMEIQGPDANFSAHPKVLTILDGPVSFTDGSSGTVVTWDWSLGDGSGVVNQTAFTHAYPNIGSYVVTLIVTDNNGCMDTVIDTIQVKDIFTLYIPNVFTPNNDGNNDFFFPQGVNVDPNEFDMYIFDRWGNMIFHTSEWLTSVNHSAPWNGTEDNSGTYEDVVMDVYVYRILCKEIEGPKHEYIGRVTLLP